MQDLEQMQRELERQGKLETVRALAATPEAAALQGRVDPKALKDPEQLRQSLEQLLRSREGQALARRIQDAMRHG